MTNTEKILATLASGKLICDDCLSNLTGIKPRQGVNQICRGLEIKSQLVRQANFCEICFKNKLTNLVTSETKTNLHFESSTYQVQNTKSKFNPTVNLSSLLNDFIHYVSFHNIDIYNEFSLQHELGIFIRGQMPDYLVQFERNIKYFSTSKFKFTKHEIDITVFSKDKSEYKFAVELKYPRNGRYPETMFDICKDIAFLEELKIAGFSNTALLILVDDPLFYSGPDNGENKIYSYFRNEKNLSGAISKPTAKRDKQVTIKGNYTIKWSDITDKKKYSIIEI